nr:hypothetical protein [Streptomyces subrutilus]
MLSWPLTCHSTGLNALTQGYRLARGHGRRLLRLHAPCPHVVGLLEMTRAGELSSIDAGTTPPRRRLILVTRWWLTASPLS